MTEFLTTYYEKDPNVVSREIAGEQILVPIRKRTADMASIYVLNETGGYIWSLLDGQHSLADIRDALAQAYEVQTEVAQEDVIAIVGQLQQMGVLRIVEHAL